MSIAERLWEAYGLEESEKDDAVGRRNAKSSKLQIALSNSLLCLRDGLPIQVPTTDFLFMGSIGAAYSESTLVSHGITHVVCLSSNIRLKFQERFTYLRVPLEDAADAPLLVILSEIFAFVEAARPGKVLIHCYQGISRSAAVCCAFLMKSNHWTAEKALEAIRTVRPQANPNPGFFSKLRLFQQQLEEEQGSR